MRNDGIVRRIDELGRVVIPKEIRRTAGIREGDPLELFVNEDGSITVKRYSCLGGIEEITKKVAEGVLKSLNMNNVGVIITDTKEILAFAGECPKNMGRVIRQWLVTVMYEQRPMVFSDEKYLEITDEWKEWSNIIIYPITNEGDVAGSVMAVVKKEDRKSEEEIEKIKLALSIGAYLISGSLRD